MRPVLSVMALLAAAAMVSAAGDTWARGKGGRGHHAGSASRHHHAPARGIFFIGAPAFVYPYPRSYYYPVVPYYDAPPPVRYEPYQGAPESRSQYWYYCPQAGAYYPHVTECAGGWQRTLPQPSHG